MKAISPIKTIISLSILFSIFLSACSSGNQSSLNANKAGQPGEPLPATYDMAKGNANASMAANTSASPYGYNEEDETGNTERYAQITENPFLEASKAPLSTFSIDVDTASYSNVRRFIKDGQLPPKDAVRIEEMVNYFDYNYPQPLGDVPFSVTTETASCPWNGKHRLAMIGLQGKKVALDNTPPSNLVFLIDVSGSMNEPNKLPLVKQGLKMLVNQIKPNDRVALAVYAGSSGRFCLPPPAARNRRS